MITARQTTLLALWAGGLAILAYAATPCLAVTYTNTYPASQTVSENASAVSAAPVTPDVLQYFYFRPVQPAKPASAGWVSGGTYSLPPDTGAVKIETSAFGSITAGPDEAQYQTFVVRLTIANNGTESLSMDPSSMRFADESGRLVTGATAYSGTMRVSTDTIGPGGHDELQIEFGLPASLLLQSLGPVDIEIPYAYGDAMYLTELRFTPAPPSDSGAAALPEYNPSNVYYNYNYYYDYTTQDYTSSDYYPYYTYYPYYAYSTLDWWGGWPWWWGGTDVIFFFGHRHHFFDKDFKHKGHDFGKDGHHWFGNSRDRKSWERGDSRSAAFRASDRDGKRVFNAPREQTVVRPDAGSGNSRGLPSNVRRERAGEIRSLTTRSSAPRISERASVPRISGRSSAPRINERASAPRIGERASAPRIGERASAPRISERSSTPRISGRSSAPRINERTSTPRINGRASAPRISERASAPRISERSSAPRMSSSRGFDGGSVRASSGGGSVRAFSSGGSRGGFGGGAHGGRGGSHGGGRR